MAKEYKVREEGSEKIIIEIPCRRQTCKDCFCKRIVNGKISCDEYLLEEYGIPDCVFDREPGKEVIYIEKPIKNDKDITSSSGR